MRAMFNVVCAVRARRKKCARAFMRAMFYVVCAMRAHMGARGADLHARQKKNNNDLSIVGKFAIGEEGRNLSLYI